MNPSLRPNRVLHKLRNRQTARGAWLFMGSATVAEVMCSANLDALIIDLEHTPANPDNALDQLRAAGRSDTTMLARVDAADSTFIKPLLDAGVEGILAPNVESAEQAARLVAACRYPPFGKRGLHYTVSRAAGWGEHAAAFEAHAADNTLVVAMIESAAGVAAIPEIARVDGVDMLFFGPLDLSASINMAGRYDAPEFLELWHEGERRCLESGLALGGTLLPGHGMATLIERGYRFVTVGADVAFLRRGLLAQLQDASA
nr:aldolase/citrate lyase family protein [Pseudoxanthomonas sp.]